METAPLTAEEIFRLFRETDLQFKETARQFKETDRKMNEMFGRWGNRLGDFVEEMVRPGAVRLFRERGIDVHEVHRDVSAKRGNDDIQIDLLVVNDGDVVAVECKSKLSVDDVNEHLEALDKFKRLLPTYANKRVMGAVAAMVLPDDVARYAYRRGLFVIAQAGNNLIVRNDDQFAPRAW